MCWFDRPSVSADGRRSSSSRYIRLRFGGISSPKSLVGKDARYLRLCVPGDEAAKEFARDLAPFGRAMVKPHRSR